MPIFKNKTISILITWLCLLLLFPHTCFAAQSEYIIITVTVDGIPPQNPTILIEDDETYTNSSGVSLSLGAEDASHMMVSQDPDFSDGQWQDYATSINFALSSEDGPEIVYAKYKDEVGNESEVASDIIILDTTAPAAVIVTDDGENTQDPAQLHAAWTESSDATSGIEEYQYAIGTSSGASDIADWTSTGLNTEVTHTGLSLTHGPLYYISVRVLDNAGNRSDVVSSDGIAYGSPPEVQNIKFSSPQNFHQSWPVEIQVDAIDLDGDTIEYRYTVNGYELQTWVAQNQISWSPTTGNLGLNEIKVEVRAPNETGASQEQQCYIFRKPITPGQ